jgi:hypothetical protein
MVYYGYDDNDVSCTVLHSKQRTARKNHACSFCNKPILAGTRYIHEAQIYDGEFQFVKYHHRYCGDDE